MTKLYVVTGSNSGIGAATKQQLEILGAHVIGVDLQGADINADLSTAVGRQHVLNELEERCSDGIDGFIPCAGVGPHTQPFSLTNRINYFGAKNIIEGLFPLLEKKRGVVVAVVSNSASLPGLNEEHVAALLEGDEEKACRLVDKLDGHQAYAGSKNALARWVRKQAPEYMQKAVRMNAVAPGITQTALTDQVFQDAIYGDAIKQFSEMTPAGFMATANMIADCIVFLLSQKAQYICGSVLFVDGGQDAMLRPDQF